MRTRAAAFVAAATTVAVLWSNAASALGPLDVEVAVKAGGGSNWTGEPPSPMGFGIGGRAGVSAVGLYAGLNGMYYAGGSTNLPCLDAPFLRCVVADGVYTYSFHSYQLGAELGYGATFHLLTIRAQVGVGDYGLVTRGAGSSSDNYFYLEPALVGLVSLGKWLIGVDVGALLLPIGPDPNGVTEHKFDAGFVAHGQVGFTF